MIPESPSFTHCSEIVKFLSFFQSSVVSEFLSPFQSSFSATELSFRKNRSIPGKMASLPSPIDHTTVTVWKMLYTSQSPREHPFEQEYPARKKVSKIGSHPIRNCGHISLILFTLSVSVIMAIKMTPRWYLPWSNQDRWAWCRPLYLERRSCGFVWSMSQS